MIIHELSCFCVIWHNSNRCRSNENSTRRTWVWYGGCTLWGFDSRIVGGGYDKLQNDDDAHVQHGIEYFLKWKNIHQIRKTVERWSKSTREPENIRKILKTNWSRTSWCGNFWTFGGSKITLYPESLSFVSLFPQDVPDHSCFQLLPKWSIHVEPMFAIHYRVHGGTTNFAQLHLCWRVFDKKHNYEKKKWRNGLLSICGLSA